MKTIAGKTTSQDGHLTAFGGNGHKGPVAPALAGAKGARWTRAGWIFLFIFAITIMFSISMAQISAGLATLCWAARWRAEQKTPSFSWLGWPIAAFVMLSLLAALLSMDMRESLKDSKDLFHFFVFVVGFDYLRRDIYKIPILLRIIAASGLGIALVGFVQVMQRGITIEDRIRGFNDMYMTYAGLLALAFVAGLAVATFDFRKWKDAWLAPGLVIILCAIVLSLTRSALIGSVAGAFVILALRKPVALIVIPILAALALALAPADVKSRFTSMFDVNADSNSERVYVWGAGLKIARDHILFGVGQNCFPRVYPEYMDPNVKEPSISHLHNNMLEIAVERGIPTLLAWLAIWIIAYWRMGAAMRSSSGRSPESTLGLVAGLGGVTAFLSIGFFEYNFGDAEPKMLCLLILAIGMAAAAQTAVVKPAKPASDN